jgi:hypothetical protein
LRGEWLARQGLPSAKRTVAACLARGWLYTGGGQLPYVALFARGGMRRAAVDKALAHGEAVEVLTVRSCAMLVGADDVPLALAAGRAAFAAGPRAQAAKLGVTDRELARLGDAIRRALDDGPADAAALRARIDPSLVRELGPAGKKLGFASTLPIAIDALCVAGDVRRAPATLDIARPAYVRWDPAPARIELDPRALAARYLAWAAPATPADLAWWMDVPAAEARALAVEVAPPKPPRGADADAVVFLPFRDNYTHLRRALAPLVDARDAGAAVLDWAKGTVPLARAKSLHQHAIIAGGALIGVWDWDAEARELVWATFSKPTPAGRAAVEAAAAATTAFVRDELGDLRYYALDGAANRAHRLAFVRAQRYRGATGP